MFIYSPREDSFLTLKVLSKINRSFNICVDVGAGSCILSQYMERLCKRIVSIDLNPRSCLLCKNYDALCADGLSSIDRADLVVSNPPYLPPEEPPSDWEALAIYDYGLINKILRWSFAHRPELLVLTYSSLGRADLIEEAAKTLGTIIIKEVEHYFFEDIISIAVEVHRLRTSGSS